MSVVFAADCGLRKNKWASSCTGSLGEIEPAEFFPLNGVTVSSNVACFPECRFYYCPEHEMVFFLSATPSSNWYEFLETLMDVAVNYCHAQEIFTIGGMLTLSAHSLPQQIITVVNSSEMREKIGNYGLWSGSDFETPPGQRPSMSSFLLWAAERRGIPGASCWVTIPFYLVPSGDPESARCLLDFFNRWSNLGLDLREFSNRAAEQNRKIAAARMEFPDIDSSLSGLESNATLTEEENEKLVNEITRILAVN